MGAAFQARWLTEEEGVRFPLLLDPDRRVYEALDLPRRWWVSLHPEMLVELPPCHPPGNRQGRIIEPNQLPGLALLDANATAVRVHRGRALGDYPPLADVLEELGRIARS